MVLSVDVPLPVTAWPISVSGWIALITSISTALTLIFGSFITYGKWLDRMNGFGARLNTVELEQENAKGVDRERTRQFDKMLIHHDLLLKELGDTKRSSEQAHEDAQGHAVELGVKVSDVLSKMGGMELRLSDRLARVETILRMKDQP